MDPIVKLELVSEKNELIILTGQAEPVHHEKAINVKNASIGAVVEYLSKKVVDAEKIAHSKVEYSYAGLSIKLLYDARQRNPDSIEGVLKLHPDLEKFNINSGKVYSTFDLADFIKMNRHYFENKDYAMKLVTELRNFEGKVNRDIEAKTDERGNKRALINQVVESNIPSGFFIELPVFVGQENKRLEIEINITSSFECSLISPDLKQFIDLESKAILNEELVKINDLHPELKVFEF